MIKLEHVNKYFNRFKRNEIHVINDTSLTLEDTGLVCFLGNSGCGKTTLLNAIGGLDKVNKGKIYINGVKLPKHNTYKIDKIRNLNIGYIFQDYNLIDNMSVYDNVALSLKLVGIKNKEEIKKRVNYVLEKVGMYKFRNRLASMLSGGQRQRVGIARAIVKNPSIIIADEPTGNLDSGNTIEIMNIIKNISRNKLVILVTHERDLAEFYSDRILEIEDGKVISDKVNEHDNELDYRIDNKIYLKDLDIKKKVSCDNFDINYYSDDPEKISLNIAVVNGNIFIENKTNCKIEISNESSVDLVDDHYKKITKAEALKYDFDLDSVSDKKYKLRYASILNPFSLIFKGLSNLLNYSVIKKILLLGFLFSGAFIMYGISSAIGIGRVSDSQFVQYNKNYLRFEMNKINLTTYLDIEKDEGIDYIMPGNSKITLIYRLSKYYQTYDSFGNIQGSLASSDVLKESDLISGRLPVNESEIVIDTMVFDPKYSDAFMSYGILKVEDLIGENFFINHAMNYTIVGVVNNTSPCIYMDRNVINSVLYYGGQNEWSTYNKDINPVEEQLLDYNIFANDFRVVNGTLPKNDYEVMICVDDSYGVKLGSYSSQKINDQKLKIVGFYKSDKYNDKYIVNSNMIKYALIDNSKNIIVSPKNIDETMAKYENIYNVRNLYEYNRSKYIKEKEATVKSVTKAALVFMAISFVEIYLMMRSSFLSRIKEVGIYRAIGLKRKDIYRLFTGEIICITTLSSVPGVLLMAYSLKELSFVKTLADKFQIDLFTVLLSIIVVYAFNLFVGLLPVYRTIRKTPSQILSRSDI